MILRNIYRIVLPVLIILQCSTGYPQEIHEAAKSGDLQEVKRLIGSNPDLISLRSPGGSFPLHFAATNPNSEVLKFMIESGANIREVNESGYTPLHYAAAYDRTENVEFLIDKGAFIEAVSLEGETPLHIAVMSESMNSIKSLIERGANIEAIEARNRTPLLLAARESGNPELAVLLLDYNADINARDNYGSNALELAAWRGYASFVDTLLNAGIRLPKSKEKAEKILGFAIRKSLTNLFNALTESCVDLETLSREQPELIGLAASGGSIDIVSKMLTRGFQLNYPDTTGWTPLHHASEYNRVEMIKFLLSRDVNINARTHIGQSAYNIALEEGSQEALGLLIDWSCDTSACQFPSIKGTYFGQPPPGEIPVAFSPAITSAHFKKHSSISFSPDLKMAAWSVMVPPRNSGYSTGRILVTRKDNDIWNYPSPPTFEGKDVPFFSPDGTRLYFISREPAYEGGPAKENIWYAEASTEGWNAPVPLNKEVNDHPLHWQFSVDNSHTLYFGTGDGRIMVSKYKNGGHQEPVCVTENGSHSSISGGSPYISPDGDYLMFTKEGDLYISFRLSGDAWSEAVCLDESINSSSNEICPIVSPDGKYLFFNRNWNIYWVGFENRIRRIKRQVIARKNSAIPER